MPDLPIPVLDLHVGGELQFILNLGAAVLAALIGGAIAVRFGQPAVLGYLLAGIALGPFTPGFTGDVEQIAVLAEVGIVLLLFALGVEFSIRDLREIGRLAVPGGLAQIALTLVAGGIVAVGLGFELRAALVIGACLSISSTLVVLKLLLDRGEMDSLHGRAAVGWAIVQDIATIVFIVALPPLVGADVVAPFLFALVKAAIFLALAYFVGTRVLPWLFAGVARLGSNELFLLTVFALALLAAFVSSAVFGLSLALGAFVGGLLVSESDLSHQAAAEVIPFRDLFAVFFFVSVGMLFDPGALVRDLPTVLALLSIAVVAKGLVVVLLAHLLHLPSRSAILLGAVMAQVGEFSFIIAENALDLGILDHRAHNIVLGTAVLSIVLSPLVLALADRLVPRLEARVAVASLPASQAPRVASRFGMPGPRSPTGLSPEDS
ncbi:MAG TPA: cation:proton antiporter, partial [Vitreimonas sp.]|nr:cation:proton antiporter [Vitreimonas sp.]